MSSLRFTEADRGPDGKLLVPGFQAKLAASMADVAPDLVATPASNDTETPPTSPRTKLAAGAGGLVLAVCLIAGIQTFAPGRSMETPRATVAVVPVAAHAPAPTNNVPTSVAVSQGRALLRAVVAFAAPGGDVLGPIEASRVYTPTGQFDGAWIQIDAAGSGAIWVRANELPEVPLPTATPTNTPLPATATPVPPPPTFTPVPVFCDSNDYGKVCDIDPAAVHAQLAQIEANAKATSAAQIAALNARPTPTIIQIGGR